MAFCTRADLNEQTAPLMLHFARWGMEVHSGDGTKDSKSEVLFCPKPAHMYENATTFDGADLSDLQLPGGRSMPIVQKFCYLGDIVASDCGDAHAVDARIESAGKAFGALRKCVFASTYVSPAAKVVAYETAVLSILLYGAESWCLTEHLYDRLRVFHARCLRCMCYVSLKHTREHRITTESLMLRLGVDAIDFYVARRQLGWAGHVCRMDFDRLPRRMLSSWVPRQAERSAASSGHFKWSRSNTSSALPSERAYVMRGAPGGRLCGTHDESMRRGSRSKSMRHTCPAQPSCRRAT